MLDDVAPVDPGRALLEDGLGAAHDLLVRRAPAAPHEHGHAARRLHDSTVLAQVVGSALMTSAPSSAAWRTRVTTVSASPFTP